MLDASDRRPGSKAEAGSRNQVDLDLGIRWMDPGIRTCGGSRPKSPRPRSGRLVDLDLIWGVRLHNIDLPEFTAWPGDPSLLKTQDPAIGSGKHKKGRHAKARDTLQGNPGPNPDPAYWIHGPPDPSRITTGSGHYTASLPTGAHDDQVQHRSRIIGGPPPIVAARAKVGSWIQQSRRFCRSHYTMVRLPGTSGDSGFHRESLEDVQVKIEQGDQTSLRGLTRWDPPSLKVLWDSAPWDNMLQQRLKFLVLHSADDLSARAKSDLVDIVKFMWTHRRTFWLIGHWLFIDHHRDDYSANLHTDRKKECDAVKKNYKKLLDDKVRAGLPESVLEEPGVWTFPTKAASGSGWSSLKWMTKATPSR
ncbi:unnamed protein product [Phytophthora fragariaefolia]|uniref:Unnamed protein product n=1 Tax=Phytophthora fragariaefolia TaxID=1490495 RepID=A0A9W6WX36_9STRA|nr:unnamed protein product [Phytophthora fragariaefolia]